MSALDELRPSDDWIKNHASRYLRKAREFMEDTRTLTRHQVEQECAELGHCAFINVDGKRVRCVCGEVNSK